MTSAPRPDADSDVDTRIRQQEVVAELGQQALETDDLDRLMHDAAAAVAETLDAEYAAVFELFPGGDDVLLRQGVGWRDGLVGSATASTERDSQTGQTLHSERPIIVDDLRTEDRFSGSELLISHDVVSGISVAIGSFEEPWGMLGTYATDRREFSEHDTNFVTSVANVLASTIESRKTRDELEEMYGRISDAFYALDENWEFTYLNDRAEELIDFTGDGLVGEHVWDTFEWADDSKLRTEYERAMETQEATSFELYYPEPLETWFEVNAFPSETGLSVYFRDVTERKETERELRANNRTLQRLYEITADRNRSFEEKVDRLLELGQDRLGLEIGFVANIDADENRFEITHAIGDDDRLRPGAVAPLSQTYCRRTIESDDLLVLADVPTEGWADDRAYEQWDFDAYVGGKVHVDDDLYGTVCFADDASRDRPFTPAETRFVRLVTQWLSYELERQHYQRELEELVVELEESNERLEQFAYAASHDLQEPLRMVTSYLQLLESRYDDVLDDDGEEFLAFAVDGAERMREMIDGLLEYSRVDTQGDPFEPVDLEHLVEDVQEDLRMRIEESDARITTGDLPRVEGDASQLRQVLQNLLDNAITYSGDESPEIRVDAEQRGRLWRISVHDDGVGIDPDDQDRIFEVFQRLHSRDEHSGTGIGLALCRRIVERHGGSIRVDSEPGGGSTFSFTLPAAD
ncbi:GAF domain-containing sensor histidine kinase [Natrarchaeobius oligotrophus]|uniref:histidine kinase n=1 Tax=Natrarchaeobius chitinivorans TaxID=1679083 RepID=A0A3N6MYC5_NATCH|nr:ATP-binding protein [Natrarchaeobius chitinivorans]RQH01472.1 GAF domain-containing protein [Natrarchaeobius chitinivorans]